MANPREVVNPFSKNQDRLRYDVKDGKWVAVDKTDYDQLPQPCSGKAFQCKPVEKDPSSTRNAFQDREDSPTISMSSASFAADYPTENPFSEASMSPKDKPRLDKTVYTTDTAESSYREEIGGCSATITKVPYTPCTPDQKFERNQDMWPGFSNSKEKLQDTQITQEQLLTQRTDELPNQNPLFTDADAAAETPQSGQAASPIHQNRSNETSKHGSADLRTRMDSVLSQEDMSQNSLEVPISIDRTGVQEIYANKPLPPIPVIPPAPKKRHVRATTTTARRRTAIVTGMAGAGMPYYMDLREANHHKAEEKKRASKRESYLLPWLKGITEKRSSSEKRSSKRQDALKARISLPGPLLPGHEGQALNPAIRYRDVGSQADPSSSHHHQGSICPIHATTNPLPNSEQPGNQESGKKPVKDKKNRWGWREAFKTFATASAGKLEYVKQHTLKKKDSDTSFACRGLGSVTP